jgi:hypothetical protein
MDHINISKYEFASKEQYEEKFDSLHTIDSDGDQVPNSHFTIVSLKNIELQKEVVDANGVVITPQVLSDKWHVDATWVGLSDHPDGWGEFSIDIDSEGVHEFRGLSYLAHKF